LAGVEGLAEQLAEREPALDILVNNAGAAWGAPIDEFPEAGWDKVMDTNVKGVFFLTQQLLPQLRRAARLFTPARLDRSAGKAMHWPPLASASRRAVASQASALREEM
jgi:2-deoxy-D-gluconate 3-dehydrogenase